MLEKIKNNRIFIMLMILFISIRFLFVLIDKEGDHIIITLANFALILTTLFYVSKFLIHHKKTILVNVSILLMLFFIAEFIAFLVSGMPYKPEKNYEVAELEEGHIANHLGHVPWADSVWHDVKTNGDKTIYDAYYTVDHLNRRITPDFDSTKSKYAVFFGCSIGYGLGLADNQTIPYQVQQNTTEYNSYNYAFTGWGMHHMLARMEHKNLSKEVMGNDGVGVYIFLWSHIRRAIGDMRIYTGWGHTMPYYYLDGNELKRDRNFAQGRWATSRFYELLEKSYLWDSFKVNLPTETREDHMILAARIIKKAKATYQKQFGNDKFYVVIHPSDWTEFTPEKNEQFKTILKERGIQVFDYSQKIPLDNDHIIVGDGHPNEKSNKMFAKMLVEDLNLK